MNFDASAKGHVKAKAEASFHQPNITLCATLVFIALIILLLLKYVYFTHQVLVLIFIFLLVAVVIGFLGVYLWRSDSTECLSISPDGTITAKSPSKQLIPALINRLTTTINRPDKLIPQGVDLKDDPSKFQSLSKSQGEEIVKKEVENAVLQHPLIRNISK